jgi:lactate dehydrogenase-like 2-hydroxyacid dehydrogenase
VLSQSGDKLKLIANFGNGVDNIDVATALQRGITVTNTPGVLTEDTADMTMALLLAVPRRLSEGAAVLTGEADEWKGWSPTWMLGHRIWGKRLGIIGVPAPSACRSTITTAAAWRRTSRKSWRPPTGRASTRCWRAWTSSR